VRERDKHAYEIWRHPAALWLSAVTSRDLVARAAAGNARVTRWLLRVALSQGQRTGFRAG
jgi:hypothetical protein